MAWFFFSGVASFAGAGELLAGLDSDWVLRARAEHGRDVADVLSALADGAEDVGARSAGRARGSSTSRWARWRIAT